MRWTPLSICAVCIVVGLSACDSRYNGAASTYKASQQPAISNSIGMEFRLVPRGQFRMATPDIGNDVDVPPEAHPRVVSVTHAYYIGANEVRQCDFERVMGSNPSFCQAEASIQVENYPVEQVTWFDAIEFCNRLSEMPAEISAGRTYRLPTEAEWEYACRSGSSNAFRFDRGRAASDRSGENAGKNDALPIRPVRSYASNSLGLYDMRGNVFEWCSDWHNRMAYLSDTSVDPRGPPSGISKVVRGGDWVHVGDACKLPRTPVPPNRRNQFIGFRVICIVHGQ